MGLYEKFNTPDWMRTFRETEHDWKRDGAPHWRRLEEEDPDKFYEVGAMCAYFEGIGVLVEQGIIDARAGDESAFCYPRFGPDKTSGNYLKHDIERMKTLLPKDGFK